MKKIGSYSLFCLIMLICTVIVTASTLIYQFSSDNIFLSPLTNIILAVFGIITCLCLFVSNPHGQIFYKIGFFILHGGLVLLIIGFIISNIFARKYTVSILKDGKYYNSIRDGDDTVDLGFYFMFQDLDIEYYENSETAESGNRSVKQYYAYLNIIYSDGKEEKIQLSINKPKVINGYRIYLMSVPVSGEDGATLLFKHDPAETTIYTGIAILILGTFIMCYLGNIRVGKSEVTLENKINKSAEVNI